MLIDDPIVLETHAGYGVLYDACYRGVECGIAIDKNSDKAEFLAQQRPTWCVYEADCVAALEGGASNHLPVNFVDLDPYGEPWPVLDAYMLGRDNFPARWVLVVNDGLRQKLKTGGAWSVGSLGNIVAHYGNGYVYENYLDICQEMIKEKAGKIGFNLTRWAGYHCGAMQQMTHYAALLERC